jgi:hypothetical protein
MVDLPDDLRDFLLQGGQLDFDPDGSSIGIVKLKSLNDVAESVISTFPGCQSIIDDPYGSLDGTYRIPVCNLIADSENYDPDGLFCWLPKLAAYATVDPEHGDIITFPDATWHMIVASPVDYLDAQWGLSNLGERVLPWLHFPLLLDDESVVEPYPKTCGIHDAPITRQTKTRHRLFEVFKDADVDEWLKTSRKHFPYAGVPASESELVCCDTCFDTEAKWVTEIESSIPLLDAKKNSGGFVQCPRCIIRFSPNDSAVFADPVHLTCGQKINVLEADAT